LEKALADALDKRVSDAGAIGNGPVIDAGALLEGVGGNRRLLQKLSRLFLADLPKLVERIKTAFDSRDGEELAKAAHALKGSIGNFGAAKAVEAASEIERLGRAGELASAQEAWVTLESELSAVRRELQGLGSPATKRRVKASRR
jgi:HPt (histidine-containing phosphotransfer) domain-containing protein